MKVKQWVDLDPVEVEVVVTTDDIATALSEEPESRFEAVRLANAAGAALKAISDELIGQMTPGQRETIAAFMRDQANRFAPPESKNEWIAVSDRQPPTDEPVVFAKPKTGGRYGVGIAYWTVSERWNPEQESQQAPEGFTHWKPLGPPPK